MIKETVKIIKKKNNLKNTKPLIENYLKYMKVVCYGSSTDSELGVLKKNFVAVYTTKNQIKTLISSFP